MRISLTCQGKRMHALIFRAASAISVYSQKCSSAWNMELVRKLTSSRTMTTTSIEASDICNVRMNEHRRVFSTNFADESTTRSIEEQYTRKTPIEHVLLRPGMYVGPNERASPQPHWILDTPPPEPSAEIISMGSSLDGLEVRSQEDGKWKGTIVRRQCEIVPALIKSFDEILVNASDNRLRHPKTTTRIDVIIDPGSKDRDPLIRVINDGKGIPVRMHRKEKMYVPELLFGHLLTGSNFDDSTKRITGGRYVQHC